MRNIPIYDEVKKSFNSRGLFIHSNKNAFYIIMLLLQTYVHDNVIQLNLKYLKHMQIHLDKTIRCDSLTRSGN